MAEFFTVGHSNNISCKVHPVIVLSVLDHFVRRNEGQKRVFGTLLGINNEGVVEIRNSFAIPHTEGESFEKVKDFHRNMHDLYLKTNPQETVVGWYSTGVAIDEDSIRVHDFYWREMLAPPLHLLIDTGLANDKLNIDAFVGSPLSAVTQENALGFQFKPVQLDFDAQKPEKIGLDVLLKAQKKEGTFVGELDSLELSLKRLVSLLDLLTAYVQRVLKGDQEADNQVGRLLAQTVLSLPKVDSSDFQKMFGKTMQDLLMVVYLANLTQTQLKISDTFTKHL
eukprot:TRINITY_DN2663_c0_g1_i1.p1 TRINITY_DN2663_c0_g1~~TRINITY_DN2663_c0_g1_i1.p1  ORF type:complete len:305 (+),score=54.53 TRINITY_DN2663_c0_g1_i1:75-917(+)